MPPKAMHKQLQEFLGERTVLVIEPSANFRTSIKQFLVNLRVKRIKLVSTVADARRELLTTKVGFFIVEWSLDDENGLQFCRALRKQAAYKDTPYILLSSENLRKDVVLASEVQVDGYLLKPFSYEDFSAQLHHVLKQHVTPGRINTLLDLAEEKLARGDVDSAAKLYEESLAIRDSSARALSGLARVKRLKDDADGAMDLIRRAILANPDYIEAYRLMLEICEERDDRTGVIQATTVLHSLSPENPRYSLMLARCYLELSALEASEKFYKKTLILSPRLADAHKGLGQVYLAKEEYEKAMKSFKRALDLDAGDVSTLNSLGMTYVRMGMYKEGIERYMIALKLDPHDARVLFNIGHAHEKRTELEKAKFYYAQALIHKAGYDKAARGIERIEKLGLEAKDDGPDDTVRKSS